MKPFLSSIALIPGPRPHVNLIRPRFSACQPPESCRRIANTGPKRGGVSHGRCHAAGFPRHMGRLRAAAGSGSGAGRPASGLPQVGALLLRLLLQIRPFPSLAHQLGPFSEQAGSQEQVGEPEEPGLHCRATSQPGWPGTGRNPASAPGNPSSQRTLKARPDFASPVGCLATPSTVGGPAAAAGGAAANSRATPGHTTGPTNRSGSPTGWRAGRRPQLGPREGGSGTKSGSSEKFESAMMEAVEFEGEIAFVT
jgi:hypothetical protein